MRRILLLTIFALSIYTSKSQQLSFTCPRDTILGCNTACFTIKGRFPDLRSLATDYTINNVSTQSQCRPYVDPGTAGPSTNLSDDDFYSDTLFLPFRFPFYGSTYGSLVASTNGYLSFDTLQALQACEWSLTPGNVPQGAPYDRALIMGPWHDIDMGPLVTTSPLRQVKFNVLGAAPNRKWVLSFFKIPLFSGVCNPLIENTHQIILHESTGVIEVFIKDKEQCPTWNSGKAMVGLQDWTQTKAVIAPGRAATDPPWGSIGMNETWRFIPKDGPTLYRSVQLLDMTGAVVATGDTTRIDINTFETTFPNVCPPPGTSLYVIKTTYQKIDDPTPGATIFSLDTINVNRTPSLPLTAVPISTACGLTTGTITVTANGGVGPYTFTLTGPGGPYAPVTTATTSTVFSNLGAGAYTINAVDGAGCNGIVNTTVTNLPNLTGSFVPTAISCPGLVDGTLVITPTLGAAAGPYTYTLTGPGGPFTQVGVISVATFTGLAGGTYSVTFSNAAGCSGTINTMVVGPGTAPTASISHVNASCPGANNGTVTVTFGGSAGAGPYNVTLNPGALTQLAVSSPVVFTGLAPNTYTATFTNAAGCSGTTFSTTVSNNTNPTANIGGGFTSCLGASDGTATVTPDGGAAQGPYNMTLNPGGYTLTGVASVGIFTGLPANTYTATFTNAAGCTGTTIATIVSNGAPPTAAISGGTTTCPGVNDGTVTVSPTGGVAQGPYNFTLNPGAITLTGIPNSITFSGLAANTYTATFTNAAGCTGTVGPVIVLQGAGVTGTSVPQNTSCPTRNDGIITVTPSGTGPFTYTLNPGGIVQVNNPVFTGLAPGTYTITFVTASGCGGTVAPDPVIAAGPFLTSTFTTFDPPCSNINNGTITITPGAGALLPIDGTITLGPAVVGIAIGPTPTFTNLIPGTYNYSFVDANGCTGTGGPVILTTHSPITTTVSLTEPLCNGNANGIVTLNASGGLAGYEYSLSPFTVYQPTGTFNGLTANTYTFRIRDAAGCTKDTTVILGEPILLTASASSPSPASCSGNDGTITVTGFGGTVPYQYSIDGVTYQAGNTFTAPAVGAYPNIKVKDAKGCIANASTTVVLVDAMFLTLGPDTSTCVGSSVKMLPQTSAGTSIYAWRPLDPVITLPSTIDTPSIRNATVTPVDTAIYILHAQWGACSREDTITVTIFHKPVVHTIGGDTAICQNTYAILHGEATNLSGPVTYSWSPAATIQSPNSPVTIATPAGTQTYTLTVTDNYGCNFSVNDLLQVIVQPPVPAYAGNDTIAILGVPHQLFGSGGVDYLWSPSAPLNLATAQNPLATLDHDQLFILKVTDIAGCIGYDTVFIQVYQGPNYYIPNAFSPNGDGLNEIFRAIPVGIAATEYFRVFNRYGQLVFETNQWLKGWDGKFKGKTQPVGVYVWIIKGIDKKGRIVEMKGTVMIVH